MRLRAKASQSFRLSPKTWGKDDIKIGTYR